MTDARTIRQRVLVVAVAAASAFAAFSVAAGAGPTDAAWVVTRTLNVTATAVTPIPPTGLSCPGSGLLSGAVPFTWTAATGTAPSGYTLKWTGAASGSTSYTGTGTSGSVTSPLGSITVSVYSDYGSWQSPAAIQTRQVNGIIFVGWTCT
jgi:hypothetical protein